MPSTRWAAVALAATAITLGLSVSGSSAAALKVSSACHTVLKTSPTSSTEAGLQPLPVLQVKTAQKLCKKARFHANKLGFFAKKKNHWRLYKRHWDQPCKQIRHRQESVHACKTARSVVRKHTRQLAALNNQIEAVTEPKIAKPLLDDFTCIHRHEAAWNDTGDPYWGGLQMDPSFEATWGPDMVLKYGGKIVVGPGGSYAVGGHSNQWTPKEQILVAIRAYRVRGFAPWPNTAHYCGLL